MNTYLLCLVVFIYFSHANAYCNVCPKALFNSFLDCEWPLDELYDTNSTQPADCTQSLFYYLIANGGQYNYYYDHFYNKYVLSGTAVCYFICFNTLLLTFARIQVQLRVPVDFPSNGGGQYVNRYSMAITLKAIL